MHLYFQKYQASLSHETACEVEGTIHFLEATSKLIKVFCVDNYISSEDKVLLQTATEALDFFQEWESYVIASGLNLNKCLLSKECREDLASTILGMESMLERYFSEHKDATFNIGLMNTDVVENFFCCQRSLCHGANTNPSYQRYASGVNSLLHSWSLTSGKGNARKRSYPFGTLKNL